MEPTRDLSWLSSGRKLAKRIPPKQWDLYKDEIERYYKEMSLEEVMCTMADKYCFKPNKRQYVHQLEKWKVHKYTRRDLGCETTVLPTKTSRTSEELKPATCDLVDSHDDQAFSSCFIAELSCPVSEVEPCSEGSQLGKYSVAQTNCLGFRNSEINGKPEGLCDVVELKQQESPQSCSADLVFKSEKQLDSERAAHHSTDENTTACGRGGTTFKCGSSNTRLRLEDQPMFHPPTSRSMVTCQKQVTSTSPIISNSSRKRSQASQDPGENGAGNRKREAGRDFLETQRIKLENKVFKFGCPFRKRNPLRFNVRTHQTCALQGYPDFCHLKQHIRSLHQRTVNNYFCPRCKIEFQYLEQLNEHLVLPPDRICQVRTLLDRDPEDGITEAIDSMLSKSSDLSGISDWDALWTVIFPGDTVFPPPNYEEPIEHFELVQQVRIGLLKLAEWLQMQNPAADLAVVGGDDILVEKLMGFCLGSQEIFSYQPTPKTAPRRELGPFIPAKLHSMTESNAGVHPESDQNDDWEKCSQWPPRLSLPVDTEQDTKGKVAKLDPFPSIGPGWFLGPFSWDSAVETGEEEVELDGKQLDGRLWGEDLQADQTLFSFG